MEHLRMLFKQFSLEAMIKLQQVCGALQPTPLNCLKARK
jgi:hypothetical protein